MGQMLLRVLVVFATTELYNSSLTVDNPDRFEVLGFNVPSSTDADWLMVNIDEDGWFVVSASDIRSKSNGFNNGNTTNARRVKAFAPDVVNEIYFGHTSGDVMLFGTSAAFGDGEALSPSSLVIHQIDK